MCSQTAVSSVYTEWAGPSLHEASSDFQALPPWDESNIRLQSTPVPENVPLDQHKKPIYSLVKLLFASAIVFIMLQNRGINFCAMRIHESYSTFSSSPKNQSIQMTLYKHGILPNSLGELFLKIRGDTNFDCCFKNSSSYFNTPMDHRGCAYLNSYVRFSLKHFVCFRYFAQDIVINFSRKN